MEHLNISPDSGAAGDDLLTNVTQITFSGDLAEAGLSVTLYDETLGWKIGAATVAGTTFTRETTLPVAGTHRIRVTVADAAGNQSSSTFNVFVDQAPPVATGMDHLPVGEITSLPVDYVDVRFTEAIDPASFGLDDIALRRNGELVAIGAGGANAAATASIVQVSPTVFRISGLGEATGVVVAYDLVVDTSGVTDPAGNAGTGVIEAAWEVIPDVDPPVVTGVAVQQGQAQRSIVRQFEVTFSEAMAIQSLIDADTIGLAVTLRNLGVDADVDPDTTVHLPAAQFSYDAASNSLMWDALSCTVCGGVERLADGYYELAISPAYVTDASGVALDGDANGFAGGTFVFDFAVLSGDVTGDGTIDANDTAVVDAALGSRPGSATWNAEADLNEDGRITTADRLIVYMAQGRQIVPPDTEAPAVLAVTVQGEAVYGPDAPAAADAVASQRSYVDCFEVTFSESVNLAERIADGSIASIMTLTNYGLNGADATAITLTPDQFSYDDATRTLRWSLDAFAGTLDSLADGYYVLTLDETMIADAAGNTVAGGRLADESFGTFSAGVVVQAATVSEYSAPAMADLNGDGVADMLVGEKAGDMGRVRVAYGTGDGQFGPLETIQGPDGDLIVPAAGCLGAAPRAMDLDGDGLADLVVGLADGTVRVYRNVGTAVAAQFAGFETLWFDVGDRAVPDFADWNGDGRTDLLVGALDGRVHLFIDQADSGAADFRVDHVIQVDGADLVAPSGRSAPAAADLDGDGLLDLIVGVTDGSLYAYRNTGSADGPSFAHGELVTADGAPVRVVSRARPFAASAGAGQVVLLVGSADGTVTQFAPASASASASVKAAYAFHRLEGDVNGDRVVDGQDEQLVVAAMSSWNANADLDRDGAVTELDRGIVIRATSRRVTAPDEPAPSEPDSGLIDAEASGDVADSVVGAWVMDLAVSGSTVRTWTSALGARIDGPADVDVFRIVAPASGALRFSASAGVTMTVYESVDSSPLQQEAAGSVLVETMAVAQRVYYVSISGIAGDYELGAVLAEADDYISLIGADVVLADDDLTGAGYAVAVLDTGVNYQHPDLAGRVILGPDFGSSDADPMDTVGHGTYVAGLLVSSNAHAPGLIPDANVVAVKITPDNSTVASIDAIVDGLTWVLDHAAEYNIVAVNLSFAMGGRGGDGDRGPLRAIDGGGHLCRRGRGQRVCIDFRGVCQ